MATRPVAGSHPSVVTSSAFTVDGVPILRWRIWLAESRHAGSEMWYVRTRAAQIEVLDDDVLRHCVGGNARAAHHQYLVELSLDFAVPVERRDASPC